MTQDPASFATVRPSLILDTVGFEPGQRIFAVGESLGATFLVRSGDALLWAQGTPREAALVFHEGQIFGGEMLGDDPKARFHAEAGPSGCQLVRVERSQITQRLGAGDALIRTVLRLLAENSGRMSARTVALAAEVTQLKADQEAFAAALEEAGVQAERAAGNAARLAAENAALAELIEKRSAAGRRPAAP